ncbi:glycosyltransferase [Candidatus Woesearchaeota archaeon]|nr:glycosyltransferase [Candidatus Woesearchaeota archaeon]
MKLSIIVPFYNEELRMNAFLDELLNYDNSDYEFIFVNDGSKDQTLNILKKYKFRNKKIITYKKNSGKGYAVRVGVLSAKGKYIIFIDADGSIHPSQIEYMLKYLKKYDVVVGTRAAKKSDVKVPLFRQLSGLAFNKYANFLFDININDALCGFKGFRRKVAINLFKHLIDNRWIFDVELFYEIKRDKCSLYAMPIKWEYKDKSKMTIRDVIKISVSMLLLRLRLIKIKKS